MIFRVRHVSGPRGNLVDVVVVVRGEPLTASQIAPACAWLAARLSVGTGEVHGVGAALFPPNRIILSVPREHAARAAALTEPD